VSPRSLTDVEPRERRRAVAHSGARITATTIALIVLYVVIPVPTASDTGTVIGLIAGLLVFVALIVWQVFSILRADYPMLRAVESLAVAVPVLIIVFAFTYLSLSRDNPAEFSEPLDHISALYFTVVTIGTVGYGDIVARSDGARLLVTVQIILDLTLVVVLARTLLYAAKIGVTRREGEPPHDSGED
jgi:hypothetical protein